MAEKKKVHIIGGGTVFHVRSHLALCAPAYGMTAKKLAYFCGRAMPELDLEVHLTKMAVGCLGPDVLPVSPASLETNEDIEKLVDGLVGLMSTKIVFFNPALTDFSGFLIGDETPASGKYVGRLDSSKTDYSIRLSPARKILGKIRKDRKDITLVAFKTTCGATEDEQYQRGMKLLKSASCNLVLANDVQTRVNMVITPEEARYYVTKDRDRALVGLVEMASLRSHLTFTRSTVVAGEAVPWGSDLVPETLRSVVNFCIKQGAYKPFMGATVGHFAAKIGPTTFLTSKRKTNFNDIGTTGLVKVMTDGPDSVIAYGSKPSVGGQSQRIVFEDHPEYDCIVHAHVPIREGSQVPTVSQREYECGSHECGKNTSKGLKQFGSLSAVYLDQHGPNIVFNSKTTTPQEVCDFITANFDLSAKTGGYLGDV